MLLCGVLVLCEDTLCRLVGMVYIYVCSVSAFSMDTGSLHYHADPMPAFAFVLFVGFLCYGAFIVTKAADCEQAQARTRYHETRRDEENQRGGREWSNNQSNNPGMMQPRGTIVPRDATI